ncbi:hypothetical protein HGB07_01825, partial [Candidatus Roizmanbacteria bacterium]|nr:hypothetical protein [Candidatus Roizmanbacteria bacterium]
YIPEFNEVVNKDNFYLKAQIYAEKGFFPGSIQKKKFLSSVMNQLLMELEKTPSTQLITMLKKSLDEKQLVLHFDNKDLQSFFSQQYWSGEMIVPTCLNKSSNCVTDYLFPFEANLGVNKANLYIGKSQALKVSINESGRVQNYYSISIKNDSPNEVFPGGTYHNYMQIALPKNAIVKSLTKNDIQIDNFDTKQGVYTTLGFLVDIPPHTTSTIALHYELPTMLVTGKGTYQLVIQKQIGSPNSDFQFTVVLPKTVHAMYQNFSPLVKDGSLNYNTTLTADKIFFIELLKE